MTLTQRDIGAYVKTNDRDAVLSSLASVIGSLVRVDDLPEDVCIRIYHAGDTVVVLSSRDDGFLDTSVLGESPWLSCAALGRFLAAQLGCIVRFDPGAEYPEISPYSDEFVQIDGDAESIVFFE